MANIEVGAGGGWKSACRWFDSAPGHQVTVSGRPV